MTTATPPAPVAITPAEAALYASLTDAEALEQIALRFSDEAADTYASIPTEGMRDVVRWCVEYFHTSGRTQAPSRELLLQVWQQRLTQCRVELPDEDVQVDQVSAAIDVLDSQYALARSQKVQRDTAIEMAKASVVERVAVIHAAAEQWWDFSNTLRDRSNETRGIQGMHDSLARYDQRVACGQSISGLRIGIEAIDRHILGVHPGEIAVWAAGPKGGKSWSMSWAAIGEWLGGRVCVLFTLENSVAMTMDRIVCQICAVDYRTYQEGNATEAEIQRIRDFLAERGEELREGLIIVSPEPGRRTPAALVRYAQAVGADSIVLDQFTHVEHPQPGRKARHEQVTDLMRSLTVLLSTGRKPLPLLMAHQFSRAGVAHIRAHETVEAEHLAEGAEIERSASWVFGLLRSETERRIGMASAHLLAGRRMPDRKSWRLAFEPWYGIQEAREEIHL